MHQVVLSYSPPGRSQASRRRYTRGLLHLCVVIAARADLDTGHRGASPCRPLTRSRRVGLDFPAPIQYDAAHTDAARASEEEVAMEHTTPHSFKRARAARVVFSRVKVPSDLLSQVEAMAVIPA